MCKYFEGNWDSLKEKDMSFSRYMLHDIFGLFPRSLFQVAMQRSKDRELLFPTNLSAILGEWHTRQALRMPSISLGVRTSMSRENLCLRSFAGIPVSAWSGNTIFEGTGRMGTGISGYTALSVPVYLNPLLFIQGSKVWCCLWMTLWVFCG